MINALTKLAQKPTDKTIRIVRVVFALILLLVIYFGWSVTAVNFGLPEELKYAFYSFPIIGIIRGVFDPGIFRKKIWKWVITSIGAMMILTSLILIDDVALVSTSTATLTASGEISIDSYEAEKETGTFTLSTDNWFGFFGFFLIIIGFLLNNKNITTKNERYGEKVTKIRV